MNNPFLYQDIASGASFCNRRIEISKINEAILGSHNVLLISPRNMGKTSLIHEAFSEIQKTQPKVSSLYIDLIGSVSERDFCKKAYESLNQIETNPQRLAKVLNRRRLVISSDSEPENTTVSPYFEAVPDDVLLDELMELLKRYSERGRMAVAFDGFQEVGVFGQGQFAKKLRSHIQAHHRIAYIFSGSQVHRLIGMFNNPSAGLYQMADTMPLSDIPAEDYAKWMTHLFRERGIELPAEFPEMIVRRFAHHPFYIQAFLHVLWEKLPSSSVKPGISDLLGLLYQIEKELIDKRRGEFEAVWEGLTLNQKRVLKLILVSQGRKVFSTQNLFKVELSAPQIANRALLSVIQKEIIIKSRIYHFADIGFKKWLQLKMR